MNLNLHVRIPYLLETAFGIFAHFQIVNLLFGFELVSEADAIDHVDQRERNLLTVLRKDMIHVLHLAVGVLLVFLPLSVVECHFSIGKTVDAERVKLPIVDVLLQTYVLIVEEVRLARVLLPFRISKLL